MHWKTPYSAEKLSKNLLKAIFKIFTMARTSSGQCLVNANGQKIGEISSNTIQNF